MDWDIRDDIADRLRRGADYYAPARDPDREVIRLDRWWIDRFVRGPRILEMGCSDGTSSELLIEKATDGLHMVEGSRNYCDRARAKLDLRRATVHHSLYEDFEPPSVFDDIVLARSLDCLVDPVKVLTRVHSWLAPGGRLHVVVQNAESIHRRLGVALGTIPVLTHLTEHSLKMGHRRIYTRDTLLRDLEAAGLTVEHVQGFFFKPFDFLSLSKIGRDLDRELIPALQAISMTMPAEICCQLYVLCE
jgi:SAM-dependent methyltransferase